MQMTKEKKSPFLTYPGTRGRGLNLLLFMTFLLPSPAALLQLIQIPEFTEHYRPLTIQSKLRRTQFVYTPNLNIHELSV